MARARDTQLSGDEARTLAISIAATGGMLLFSDDWPSLDAGGRQLVRGTLAAARDVDGLGLPSLARVDSLLAGDFANAIVAADAEGGTFALLNPGDAPETLALDLDAHAPLRSPPEPLLASPPAQPGPERQLRVSLAPHASALFRVRRVFPLAVFCDFDGTFSVQDVGATLAKIHAGDRRPAAWARFERGEISAWEYNLEILDRLPLSEAGLEAFLRTIELDPGAVALVDWCRERRLPFRVLSDGFDYNLNRLQALHGVRFAYAANHLRYEDGRWRIAAAHPDPACGCGTGTCKRGRIEAFRSEHPGARVVHIGNGRVSDLCGALAADVAFAKDSLARELSGRDVPYRAFETLLDVIPQLERLLAEARG